jgi:demethylmenaquinone methyltransferase/2-methoxy-6-polyprenyl-1,4-benzoquinol methylase
LKNHFDLLAPIYDNVIKATDFSMLEALLKLPITGILLDAGGGTGRVSDALSGKASSIVVADLSHPMLKQSIKKQNLSPVCTHSEFLPFPSNYFERIIMVDAFHHVCDQVATANELWRVLKQGGRMVIEEPNINKFGVKMVALGEKITLMRSKFLTPEKIQDQFNFEDSNINIRYQGYNSWIVIDKKKIEKASTNPG